MNGLGKQSITPSGIIPFHEMLPTQEAWARIEYHGIAPSFYEDANGPRVWPKELWKRIANESRLAGIWEATHQGAVANVIDQMAKAGIKTLVMKGTALAYCLYPKPETRRRGDTDLLVQPCDLSAAREMLSKLGWTRQWDNHGVYFQENWVHDCPSGFKHVIDLHWQANDRPAFQSILPIKDLFDTAMPLRSLSASAKHPALAYHLVQCALNQEWHFVNGYRMGKVRVKGAHRLIWQCDLHLLIRALSFSDWQLLEAICREKGIGPFIAAVVGRSDSLVADGLITDKVAALSAMPRDHRIETLLSSSDGISNFWLDLRATQTWKARLGLLINRAFPPIAHLKRKYPDTKSWPRALLVCRFLFDTAGRVLTKAFRL
ncbi:MAG: nucleotidyltransferase family protein [Pseudomonadota bacterium]